MSSMLRAAPRKFRLFCLVFGLTVVNCALLIGDARAQSPRPPAAASSAPGTNNAPHAPDNPPFAKAETKLTQAVRSVLDMQVVAWNRGDIAGFMRGYWNSPDTVFVSGDSVTRGWQTVSDRYKRGYNTREKMGTLAFSDLTYNVLNKETVIVVGRWQLARAQDNPHGRFTLIFRKFGDGWRIVHDHTSSAE